MTSEAITMADFREFQQQIDRQIHAHTTSMQSLHQHTDHLQQRFDEFLCRMDKAPPHVGSGFRPPHGSGQDSIPVMSKLKLEIPKTDGSDPLGWLFKAHEYFVFYAVPDEARLPAISMMLEGPALDWFRWRHRNGLLTSWADFVNQFKLRFDPLSYVDYFALLSKIQQTGSPVNLRSNLRHGQLPFPSGQPNFFHPRPHRRYYPRPAQNSLCPHPNLRLGYPCAVYRMPSVRNVMPKEGHNCGRFLLLFEDDDVEDPSDPVLDDTVLSADVSSLHSLAGVTMPRSLRLSGMIASAVVDVLIDGGSTHNFIHPSVVEKSKLPIMEVPAFWVYVGNGASLTWFSGSSGCNSWVRLLTIMPISLWVFLGKEAWPLDLPADIRRVLQTYGSIFSQPTGLPPRRLCDHRIFLQPGLKVTPFQVVYGRPPPELVPYTRGASRVQAVDDILAERDALLRRLRADLQAAQHRMKMLADRKRREVEFAVGDLVLLKLQPYRQTSVARRVSQKLSMRFFGPFEVLERIGPVAYRLKLPETCRIHPVFHVSLLRPIKGTASSPPILPLPTDLVDGRLPSVPVQIHDTRRVLQNGVPEEQYLVRWSDGTLEDATWEPAAAIRRDFPNLPQGGF
ncbi:unnamed protein product [Cuscuta campestris]|uniref:Tf2-1-like SH3-like domain-containing protein n=1 Tax=Cuscuta campestris TaxID=132261 RepID=A0A484MJF7_9ASTE|nr:unnamed protein product [Cuscuta campestris]